VRPAERADVEQVHVAADGVRRWLVVELAAVQQQPQGEAEISEQQQQLVSAHADMSELHNQLFDKQEQLEALTAEKVRLEEASTAAAAAVHQTHQQAIAALQNELAESASVTAQAAQAAQDAQEQAAQLHAALTAAEAEAAAAVAAAAAAGSGGGSAGGSVEGGAELAFKVTELQSTLEKERAENEDLLVFLAEQDAKIKGYRERLVAAGQEVSDEEDDSDGDDDDDDDDEVDDEDEDDNEGEA